MGAGKAPAAHESSPPPSARVTRLLAGVLALVCILTLVSIPATWALPWIGVYFDADGTVTEVTSDSPNREVVRVGDQILAIQGRPLEQVTDSIYGPFRAGEEITYSIQQGAAVRDVPVQIEAPPGWKRLERLVLLVLGASFLLLGTLTLARRNRTSEGTLFALMCALFTTVLVTTELSTVQVLWAGYISQVAIGFSFALFLHFHLLFAGEPLGGGRKIALASAYLLAAGIGAAYLSVGVFPVISQPWYPLLTLAKNLLLLGGMGLSAALLVRAWRRGLGHQRRRVRVIVLGTLLTVVAFVGFIYAAELTGNDALVTVAAWSLLFIPISYGYTLQNYNLHELDLRVYRLLLYLLLTLILMTSYLVLARVSSLLFPNAQPTVTGGLVALILSFFYGSMRGAVERGLNRFLYGVGYDYLRILKPAVERLDDLDDEALVEVLTEQIPEALGVQRAGLWRVTTRDEVEWMGGAFQEHLAVALPPEVKACLRQGEPLVVTTDAPSWAGWELAGEVRWLVPLVVGGELEGCWLVGAREGDGSFAPLDRELLSATARTAALVLKVIRLVGALNARLEESRSARTELAQAYQLLSKTRERERRYLARELHDEVLQALVGFHSISEYLVVPNGSTRMTAIVEDLRSQIPRLIESVLEICQGLRPSTLEKSGLKSATNQLVAQLLHSRGIETRQEILLPTEELDSDAQMDLYRIVQESLRNIVEHADATSVSLVIRINGEELELDIKDDGVGFDPEQARGRRMGLIGLQERAVGLNGRLDIESAPGAGTHISARIPFGALLRDPDEIEYMNWSIA